MSNLSNCSPQYVVYVHEATDKYHLSAASCLPTGEKEHNTQIEKKGADQKPTQKKAKSRMKGDGVAMKKKKMLR